MKASKATFMGLLALFLPLLGSDSSGSEVDPPDSVVNPLNGQIEIADPVWSGIGQNIQQDIQYVAKSDQLLVPTVFTVTADPRDDRRPRLAIAANGDAWIVWWRDDVTDEVLARKRTQATGTWSSERVLSLVGESAANPHAVHDGTQAWVAYEVAGAGSIRIVVGVITDEPDPLGATTLVGLTTNEGALDLLLHAESGRLWITWQDGPVSVGWSEFDYATGMWSPAAYEPWEADGLPGALVRIQAAALAD